MPARLRTPKRSSFANVGATGSKPAPDSKASKWFWSPLCGTSRPLRCCKPRIIYRIHFRAPWKIKSSRLTPHWRHLAMLKPPGTTTLLDLWETFACSPSTKETMLKTFKCGNIRAESSWGRSESPCRVYCRVNLSESTSGQQLSWLVPTSRAVSPPIIAALLLNQDKGIFILNVLLYCRSVGEVLCDLSTTCGMCVIFSNSFCREETRIDR